MSSSLLKLVLGRKQNVGVQRFALGLDFSDVPTGARLAERAYVAVQIPESLTTVWEWSDWIFDREKGRIVSVQDHTTLIPYNYMVFGLSKCAE